MRPPLSFVPLLPVAALLMAIIAVLKLLGYFDPYAPALPEVKAVYSGVVTEVVTTESGQSVTAEFRDTLSKKFKALLTIASTEINIGIGDSIIVNTKLSRPVTDNSVPDIFDYASYLRGRGISAVGYVSSSNVSLTYRSNSVYARICGWRTEWLTLLRRSGLTQGSADFLATALLGDESSMQEAVRQTFTGAGQAHMLALSGLHVGIITALIFVMLFPLYLLRLRTCRLIITIGALWIYAVVTGLSPSVVRAVIMATCIFGGDILQRRYVSLNSLLFAAVVILLVSPSQLFDIGFQMSFMSVGFILIFMPLLNRVFVVKNVFLRYLVLASAISICATAGGGILSVYYFHIFPLYFLPANLPIMLILPVLMGAGVLLLILEYVGFEPSWLCSLINFCYDTVYNYADWIGGLPHAVIRHLYVSPWMLVPYYCSVLLLAVCLWLRNKWAWGLSVVAVLLVAVMLPQSGSADRPTCEYFIPRDSRTISILYYDGIKVQMMTTAPPMSAADLLVRGKDKYRDFLGKRGLDSIAMMPDTVSTQNLFRCRNFIELHGVQYLFVDADSLVGAYDMDGRLSYAVVCNGFRGNILDIARVYAVDTILLASNLNVRRHDRYVDSLERYAVPYRSLRHTPHRIIVP